MASCTVISVPDRMIQKPHWIAGGQPPINPRARAQRAHHGASERGPGDSHMERVFILLASQFLARCEKFC